MKSFYLALQAEFIKGRHSTITWAVFVAFALGPIMGGIFLVVLSDPDLASNASALNAKAEMLDFEANWNAYLNMLAQVVGVGGVLVFGFVISWIFGREYTEGTIKDLLALPVSRAKILNAKFVLYILWCLALCIANLIVGVLIGAMLGTPGFSIEILLSNLGTYFVTTVLVILLGFPIAFLALWGRGYLTPLAFIALTLVFSQILAALGAGQYFPWSVPGLYSGTGGEFKELLNGWSYGILVMVSLLGYGASLWWWKWADL